MIYEKNRTKLSIFENLVHLETKTINFPEIHHFQNPRNFKMYAEKIKINIFLKIPDLGVLEVT